MESGQNETAPPHQVRRVFITVAAGVFMSTMDSSLVNVALPSLMEVFQSSLAVTEWVVLIYLLTITVLLVFWGRLCSSVGLRSDLFPGHAPVRLWVTALRQEPHPSGPWSCSGSSRPWVPR